MVDIKDLSKCCGCGACEQICPKHCITMASDAEGFLYPQVDGESCIACGKCERICPFGSFEKKDSLREAYAAVNKDEETRFCSSSGGLFSAIAELVMDSDGEIYGAFFSDDFKSVHHGKNPVQKLRTSKYVQSIMGNAYAEAENDLKQGKQVLFTGTPCQIAGLKNYLKVDYDNLLCVDVICHGVPSPGIWESYLTDEEKKNNGKTRYVNFRHKKSGWQQFKVNMQNDCFERYDAQENNPYMNLFLKNYSLRPSCYECRIKERGSFADITLGDFWGIEKVAPEMNDGKGTSLVIINTQKGLDWFERSQNHLVVKKVAYEEAVQFNTSLFKSVSAPENRAAFFADSKTMSVNKLSMKYCGRTMKERIAESTTGKLIKKIIRRGGASSNQYGLYFVFEC